MPAMYSMDVHAGKPVIEALGVGRPCCGTYPPFAHAAIADAESFRPCGRVLVATQRISRLRSFIGVNFGQIQTARSPQPGPTKEERDFSASRPNGVNWRFRCSIAISMNIHERQLPASEPSEQPPWDNQIDSAVHVKTDLMLLQPCQSTNAERAAVIIAGIPSFQESKIR